MSKQEIFLSVCVPTYNASATIVDTIKSILGQTDKNFELVIVDNCSTDNTLDLVRKFKDKRIKLYVNFSNLGCGGNLTSCLQKSRGEIVYFVCADDLIDINTIKRVKKAFRLSSKIGVVTRPYFWFENELSKVIRVTEQFDSDIWIKQGRVKYSQLKSAIGLSDQISGIGLRKKYIQNEFSLSPFVEMASVVLPMLKISDAYILKDNVVAIRMAFSGSKISSVYINSPMMSWLKLIQNTFREQKYVNLVSFLIYNFIANNYVGLIQIKNYGTYPQLLREIWLLIKLKPDNLLNFKFWSYVFITMFTPREVLRWFTNWYKNKINSKFVPTISFQTA